MEELKEFKDRLRKARVEKNISQVELGRLTGESQSKIAALESGRNKKHKRRKRKRKEITRPFGSSRFLPASPDTYVDTYGNPPCESHSLT